MKHKLLDLGEDVRLSQFLCNRSAQAHILAPADFLQVLRERAPGAKWTQSETVDKIPAAAKRIFVYDPEDETGVMRAVQEAKQTEAVYGVLHHIVPMLAVNKLQPDIPKRPKHDPLDISAPPATCFAVVCTPRTGSTFFCELLEAGGLGMPKEHLRPALVHVLRAPRVEHEIVYDQIMRAATVNGIFGTKIISHFLFDVAGQDRAAERLECLSGRGFKFIRLRRDEVEQAISKYSSKHSGIWHERGEVSSKAQQRIGTVPYVFDEIHETYRKAIREGEALDVAMKSLPAQDVLELDYADFTHEPLNALQEAANFLGVQANLAAVKFEELPAKLSSGVDHIQELRERFVSELKAR
ncbi:Stf0 family sulfotransferase [Ideonella sp.]|uniref:Stf0 family sulfotransferase n=1 Tax=Ideonella sp. TaxID=1929293 RepID=UPI003BB60DC8